MFPVVLKPRLRHSALYLPLGILTYDYVEGCLLQPVMPHLFELGFAIPGKKPPDLGARQTS